MGNKYHAVRTPCSCGVIHDSKMEAAHCQELQVREKAGDIGGFYPHPHPIILVPKKPGCKAMAITWRLDFLIFAMPSDAGYVAKYYVDIKGARNRETQLKIRLWQLMDIPWELRIVYPDKVEVYNAGGGE